MSRRRPSTTRRAYLAVGTLYALLLIFAWGSTWAPRVGG